MTDIAINPVTRRVQFQGTTGTGPFAFNFNILQASDIAVYKNNTLLSIGTGATNYSVSIASNGTGSVSVVTALIASDVLVIIGGRELSRTTDFVTAGDLLASSLNEQLDSNVVMSQQLDESISRSIRAQPGDTEKTLTLPLIADRANEIIKFDGTGNVTTIPVSEIIGTDIDTQKVTVKTSGGVVKAVIDGNTTNILTVTGPVVLKEGTNTRITINPAADNNSFTSDANFSLISTSGDIDIKPGGGQVNLLGTSGQQRIAFDNAAQATMQYFQNSNTTKLGVVDPTGARTLLLPNASDTLVGKATTDTLTNKTLASPVITGSLGVGTLTGSGDILLDAAGDIVLDAAGDQIFFKDGGTLRITFELGSAGTSMVSASELVMAVTSGGINFKPQTGNVDFLQNSGAQAVQINSAGSSTITYYQNSNTTKLGVVNPTGSRVLLLPNASDTLVGLATTDTLTNKTLANPTFTGNLNFSSDITLDAAGDITLDADGGQIFIKDGGALKLTFTGSTLTSTGLDGINLFSSNDIALKAAGGQVDFLGTSGEQRILINNAAAPTIKYFQNSNTTSLGIVNPTGTRALLLPDASDTLVGKATTDTLTNKTLTSPTITGSLNMSDVDITNVGSIALDRIANDGSTGITLDSSVDIVLDAGGGQIYLKNNGQQRGYINVQTSELALQATTALKLQTGNGSMSFVAGGSGDINLQPAGGQVFISGTSGQDRIQFNNDATPTMSFTQNSNITNLGVVDPTATRTILFPNASDTLVGKATTDTLTNKTLTSPVINTGVSGSAFLDEDNFASNSATKIASQQSIKAYVDAATAGGGAGSLSTVLGIGNTTGSNNVLFGDNNKAIFGAGSDLQIYSDGTTGQVAGNVKVTGNVGIGVVPSAWASSSTALQIGSLALEDYAVSGANFSNFYNNAFRNTSGNVVYTETDFASLFQQYNGEHIFKTAASGSANATITFVENLRMNNAATVFNEGSADIDFRVESNGNANMLFVDGGNDRVGVGTASPNAPFVVSNGGAAGIELHPELATDTNRITNFDRAASAYMNLKLDALRIDIQPSGSRRFSVATSETVANEDSANHDFRVESDANANMLFVDGGNNSVKINSNSTTYDGGSPFQIGYSSTNVYHPQIQTDNRTYVHFTGAGGGSANNSYIHGYQIGNPSLGNYLRVAPGLSNNIVSGVQQGVNGLTYVYNSGKATGNADYTPTISHKIDFGTGGSVVFNEASADIDFRIESNANANLMFVNAGQNRLGFFTSTTTASTNAANGICTNTGIGTYSVEVSNISAGGNSGNIDIPFSRLGDGIYEFAFHAYGNGGTTNFGIVSHFYVQASPDRHVKEDVTSKQFTLATSNSGTNIRIVLTNAGSFTSEGGKFNLRRLC